MNKLIAALRAVSQVRPSYGQVNLATLGNALSSNSGTDSGARYITIGSLTILLEGVEVAGTRPAGAAEPVLLSDLPFAQANS